MSVTQFHLFMWPGHRGRKIVCHEHKGRSWAADDIAKLGRGLAAQTTPDLPGADFLHSPGKAVSEASVARHALVLCVLRASYPHLPCMTTARVPLLPQHSAASISF